MCLYINKVVKNFFFQNVISYRCSSDSDEEPVTKQPRLSRRQFREPRKKTYGDSERPSLKRRGVSKHLNRKVGVIPNCFSDSDMSSGTQNNDEESYFEVNINIIENYNNIYFRMEI